MKYLLLHTARKNLNDIADYTTKNWGSDQRRKYLKIIYDHFELISKNPQIGRLRDELFPDIRSIVVESHFIYYANKQDHVAIVTVLHKKMDPNLIEWNKIS